MGPTGSSISQLGFGSGEQEQKTRREAGFFVEYRARYKRRRRVCRRPTVPVNRTSKAMSQPESVGTIIGPVGPTGGAAPAGKSKMVDIRLRQSLVLPVSVNVRLLMPGVNSEVMVYAL